MNDAFLGRLAIAKLFDSVLDKDDLDLIEPVNIQNKSIAVAIHKKSYMQYTDVEAHVGELIFKFIYKGAKNKPMDDALLCHITTQKMAEED